VKRKFFLFLFYLPIILILLSCGNEITLQNGKYITEDGFTWIILHDDYKFEFQRSLATSYCPEGRYSIKNNKLTLYVSDDEIYTFIVKNSHIVFKSGIPFGMAIIEEGTVLQFSAEAS